LPTLPSGKRESDNRNFFFALNSKKKVEESAAVGRHDFGERDFGLQVQT
jgi:hypothetical protein